MFEHLSPEEVQRLRQDPRTWSANLLSHPDDPQRGYDFRDTSGDTKLNYLLSEEGPLNPDNWANVNILLFCRGGLKTTVMTILSAWALHMHPTTNIYMTAPREKQIKEFSERLDDKIRQSGLDRRCEVDNQQRKVFEIAQQNDDGTKDIYKAKWQADSGWGEGDALRGPHSHIGIIDEMQDMTRSAFETFTPAIDRELPHADWSPLIFVIGTPQDEGSFYHDLWQKTDQRDWNREKRLWEPQSERTEFAPSKELAEQMGFDADEIEGYEVAGWHLDAYNSPIHTPQAIARDKANFTPRKFTNEVEAQFFAAEDDLLTIETVKERFFDDGESFSGSRKTPESFVALGCDWGGGADKNAADTVVTVVEWQTMDDGSAEGEVLKTDFLDAELTPDDEIREVENYIQQYDVDTAVVDYGHGHKSMMDLQDGNGTQFDRGYPNTVVGAKYGNLKNKSEVKFESSSGQRRFFTCDKTYAIESMVEYVRDGSLTCPAKRLDMDTDAADGAKIVRHLTNPYKDFKTNPSGAKKIRVMTDDNDSDDFADALTYCALAYDHIGATSPTAHVAMGNSIA